jgi:septum formation protein
VSKEPIILASASPRRRELLAEMGVPFAVVTADITEHDEKSAPHLAPAELACENARGKALAVAALHPGRWVLGADTVVALERRVHRVRANVETDTSVDLGHSLEARLFGKPASLDEAREFLRALSGQTHEVITGCALFAPNGETEIFHEVTRVTFHALSEEIITRYLAEVSVLDKAGAYALQEHGEWIIERVEGSRTNVIGLPTELLERVFRKRGLI